MIVTQQLPHRAQVNNQPTKNHKEGTTWGRRWGSSSGTTVRVAAGSSRKLQMYTTPQTQACFSFFFFFLNKNASSYRHGEHHTTTRFASHWALASLCRSLSSCLHTFLGSSDEFGSEAKSREFRSLFCCLIECERWTNMKVWKGYHTKIFLNFQL